MNTKRTEHDLLRDMLRLLEDEQLLKLRWAARKSGDLELAQRILDEFQKRETKEEADRRGAMLRAALQRSFRISRLIE